MTPEKPSHRDPPTRTLTGVFDPLVRLIRSLVSGVTITRWGLMGRVSRSFPHRSMRPLVAGLLTFAAAVLIGLGVSCFSRAGFGLPPYDVALSAIAGATGLSHGRAGWVLGGALFSVAAVLGRPPGLRTIGWVVIAGTAVDLAMTIVGPTDRIGLRLVLAVVGLLAIAFGIALLLEAGGGGGALELLTAALADRGLPMTRTRTVLELLIVAGGALGGGSFGPATLAFALAIGPIIAAGTQALADHRAGRAVRLAAPALH